MTVGTITARARYSGTTQEMLRRLEEATRLEGD
jgi:hypothetical protein